MENLIPMDIKNYKKINFEWIDHLFDFGASMCSENNEKVIGFINDKYAVVYLSQFSLNFKVEDNDYDILIQRLSYVLTNKIDKSISYRFDIDGSWFLLSFFTNIVDD